MKSEKIADQAIFYSANSQSSPENRAFCVINDAKSHKSNRLLGLLRSGYTAILRESLRKRISPVFASDTKKQAPKLFNPPCNSIEEIEETVDFFVFCAMPIENPIYMT
jgi:hypothetical protein